MDYVDSKINICFSSDNNYAPHVAVAILSILETSPNGKFSFYILDGGITEEYKEKILKLKNIKDFEIQFIKMDNENFKNCPITNYVNYITISTYYRFMIPSLLSDLDKVIYLDCDIIAVDDITELWNQDISTCCMAAVPDTSNDWHRDRLNLSRNYYYCNAGVLLINNKRCKEHNVETRLFEYAKNPDRKITFQDQDVLNIVLKDELKYLHIKWDVMHNALCGDDPYPYHPKQHSEALETPYLIHFTNTRKPWNFRCENPYKRRYMRLLKKTEFTSLWKKIKILVIIEDLCKSVFSYQKTREHKIFKILGIKIKRKRPIKLWDIKRITRDYIQESIGWHDRAYKDLFNEVSLLNKFIERMNYSNSESNKEKILQLKDKYKGKRCFLLGSSPSLKNLDLKKLENECTMTVGKGFKLRESGLKNSTFHVMSDFVGFLESEKGFPADFSEIYFTSQNVPFIENEVKSSLKFYYKRSGDNGFKFEGDILKPLYTAETVITFAMAIAFYLGFKEVILIGVDLDFTAITGHAYESSAGERERQKNHSINSRDEMLNGIKISAEEMKKQGTTVLNASPAGIVDCVPRVKYEDLF